MEQVDQIALDVLGKIAGAGSLAELEEQRVRVIIDLDDASRNTAEPSTMRESSTVRPCAEAEAVSWASASSVSLGSASMVDASSRASARSAAARACLSAALRAADGTAGCAVAGDIIGLGGGFLQKLSPHVLVWVL